MTHRWSMFVVVLVLVVIFFFSLMVGEPALGKPAPQPTPTDFVTSVWPDVYLGVIAR